MLNDARPLFDADLERQTLGLLMLLSEGDHNIEEIKRALGIVRAKDFFREQHKLVFAAILTLHKGDNHFGVEAVASLLERKGKLDDTFTRFDIQQMRSEGARAMPLIPAEQALALRRIGEFRESVQATVSLRQFIETTDDGALVRARWKELGATLERGAYATTSPTQSFKDLMATNFPPVVPVLAPLIMAGDSMLIVGNSKTGKSVFALQLALAIAAGSDALENLPTSEARDVLFLNLDDRPSRIKARAEHMMAAFPEGVYPSRLHFAHQWPPMDQGGEGMLHSWAEKHTGGVIFIDLLEKIRPARGGNIYQADYAAVGAITDVAHRNGVTTLTVHHSNKSGLAPGSEFNADFSVSGSEAIRGAADGHIVFHPTNQDLPDERVITVKSRDTAGDQYKMEWDEFVYGWKWGGPSLRQQVVRKLGAQRQAILDTIQEAGRPLKPGEIAQRLDKNTNSTYNVLFNMKNATPPQIIEMLDGTYQHPAEYARTKDNGSPSKAI